MSENLKRNPIWFLEASREEYESNFQYDPHCLYHCMDDFLAKVKEVLNAGYDYDTETLILEKIPYCERIEGILGLANVYAMGSGISVAPQNAMRRMKPFWEKKPGRISPSDAIKFFKMDGAYPTSAVYGRQTTHRE